MEEFYVAKFLTLNTHSWLGEDPKWALETLGKQILKADYDNFDFKWFTIQANCVKTHVN